TSDSVKLSYNPDVLAEEGLAPISGDDMEVAVKIKGRRSDVNSVRKTGLTAYVDVSSCKKGENSEEIVINTPDGISIETVSEEYLTFEVEELAEEEKTLNIEFDKENGESESKVPWVVAAETDSVTVKGAKSLVDKVESVKGIVSSENMPKEKSEWRDVSVTAVDKDGNIVPDVSILNGDDIQAQVRLMALKTVELDISSSDLREDFQIDKLDVADNIRIVGPEDMIQEIDKIKGFAELAGIDDTQTHKINVNLDLPEGIYLYDQKNPLTVKVKLKAVE
ncbi:MAG: YbbR-like domain-containing protein, partial [Lentihominibacter sp.]